MNFNALIMRSIKSTTILIATQLLSLCACVPTFDCINFRLCSNFLRIQCWTVSFIVYVCLCMHTYPDLEYLMIENGRTLLLLHIYQVSTSRPFFSTQKWRRRQKISYSHKKPNWLFLLKWSENALIWLKRHTHYSTNERLREKRFQIAPNNCTVYYL